MSANYEKRKAAHLCVFCKKPLDESDGNHVMCVKCRTEQNSARRSEHDRTLNQKYKKDQYYRRKLNGECPICGKKLTDEDGYHILCDGCRQKAIDKYRRRTV